MNSNERRMSEIFSKYRDELKFAMPDALAEKINDELFPQRRPFFQWMAMGGGAVAAAMALVMAFQLGKMSGAGSSGQAVLEEVVASHVRSLMVTHLSDVESTDQHTVKPWFEGKIDFAPTVKDFAKDGFPLVGGRLDYIQGRPTAALVYKFNKHVINVLEHPAPIASSAGPQFSAVRGYQIFWWTKDGMSHWAISDLNATDLQKFVELWL